MRIIDRLKHKLNKLSNRKECIVCKTKFYSFKAVITSYSIHYTKLYEGIERIDDTTIHGLAERVRADNTSGLYRRVLQERCRIETSMDHCLATWRLN